MSFISTLSSGSYKGYQSINASQDGVLFYTSGNAVSGPLGSALSLDGNYFGQMWTNNVYIYSNNNNNWSLQQSFINCSPRSIEFSSNGDRFIIGSSSNSNVAIYVRSGNTWSLEQSITPNDAPTSFAISSAINGSGNTILVGSVVNNATTGNVYYFSRTGNTWSQIQKFTPTPNTASFGVSASLNEYGNIAIIASQGNSNITGNTYFYTRTGNSWTQQQNFSGNTSFVDISNDGTSALRTVSGNISTFKFSNTWVGVNQLSQPANYRATSAYLNSNGNSITTILWWPASSTPALTTKYKFINNAYTQTSSVQTPFIINNFSYTTPVGTPGGVNADGNLFGAHYSGPSTGDLQFWSVLNLS